MHDPLAQLLALRLRYRRHPQARAYVDRALGLVARALVEDADLADLEADVAALAADLAVRFGPPKRVTTH